MFKINKKFIIISGFVLVVGAIIIVNQLLIKPESLPPMPESSSGNKTSGNDSSGNGGVIIKTVPTSPIQNYPRYAGRSLNEVKFGQGFNAPEEYIVKQKKDLTLLASVLSKNPISNGGVDDWIAVGVIKKSFNDYEGARDAWEYAGVLYPANGLSFANLGNLYGFYLHDNEKAELNFKKAIQNDLYQPGYYLSLADFYKTVDVAKKSEASKVLLEGMSVIKDVNLILALASYYRGVGDKTNAIKYYQEVLKISPDQAGVREEIDKLK